MSTEPNLRMLFNQYHSGFDNYGAWYEHHKAMHAKHPLECAEFGAEWLRRWEALWFLLQRSAQLEFQDGNTKRWWVPTFDERRPRTVEDCIETALFEPRAQSHIRRVVLEFNGTIVREWPAKDDYDDIF